MEHDRADVLSARVLHVSMPTRSTTEGTELEDDCIACEHAHTEHDSGGRVGGRSTTEGTEGLSAGNLHVANKADSVCRILGLIWQGPAHVTRACPSLI